MPPAARWTVACLQATLGLTAHVAAAGCLPNATVLVVLLPGLVLGADLGTRLMRTVPRWMALVAGQCVVHVVLSLAAGCSGAAAAGSHSTALGAAMPVPNLVMAPAHVVALLVCVAAATWVDRAMKLARQLRNHVCRRIHAAVSLLMQGGGGDYSVPRVPEPGYRVTRTAVTSGRRCPSRAPPRHHVLLST